MSNIMMQIQANLLNINISRPKTVETTALGAAYMAGLAVGFWKDREELSKNRQTDRIFSRQWKEKKPINSIRLETCRGAFNELGNPELNVYEILYF